MHAFKKGPVLQQSLTGLIHALKRRGSAITKWGKFDA